jgi:rhamnosyltransferase
MSTIVPVQQNTCAVIVTFHPDKNFPERLQLICAQFPLVVIVDNGSNSATVLMLEQQAATSNVLLSLNAQNFGIAKALNQGIELAKSSGFDWIVTFDQDSNLRPNLLQILFDIYAESGGGNVLIGANYWDAHKGRDLIQCKNSVVFQQRKTLITSGTLMPLCLFETIGLFKENYFIDSVDHEICLRARASGWRILISCTPCMSHSIGANISDTNWLRKKISFTHSPTRKYFIARNTIFTVKQYLLQEPLWCCKQIFRLSADFIAVILFEQKKMQKIGALLVGLAHGITGKLGPIEETWPNGFR